MSLSLLQPSTQSYICLGKVALLKSSCEEKFPPPLPLRDQEGRVRVGHLLPPLLSGCAVLRRVDVATPGVEASN